MKFYRTTHPTMKTLNPQETRYSYIKLAFQVHEK